MLRFSQFLLLLVIMHVTCEAVSSFNHSMVSDPTFTRSCLQFSNVQHVQYAVSNLTFRNAFVVTDISYVFVTYATCARQHTHHPHLTHSTKAHGDHHHHVHPTEAPSTTFRFDSHSLTMMAYKDDACYLYVLKVDEYHHSTTPEGLQEIETKMDNMIASNNGTLVPLQLADLTHEFHGLNYHCYSVSNLYIIK